MNPAEWYQQAGQFSDGEMTFLAIVFVIWCFGILGIVVMKMGEK